MYKLQVQGRFAAAHHLREYKGKCENLHGHNWQVFIRVGRVEAGKDGMVMDFKDLREILGRILGEFDHSYINEHPHFQTINPTSENIARYIFDQLADILSDEHPDVEALRVGVEESPGSLAIYEP